MASQLRLPAPGIGTNPMMSPHGHGQPAHAKGRYDSCDHRRLAARLERSHAWCCRDACDDSDLPAGNRQSARTREATTPAATAG